MQYKWIVTKAETSLTLLQYLHNKLQDQKLQDKTLSLKKIKSMIDAGYCYINAKKERFYRTLVAPGMRIELAIPEQTALEFIFEDDDILVVNKPVGITCDDRLVAALAKLDKKIELVHRLDKETTGLLLCAKKPAVKTYLLAQFKQHAIEKAYVAIVDGVVKEQSGQIENYLGPIHRYEGHVKWGAVTHDGHYAATNWQLLQRGTNASMLLLVPMTGKTHQLRVHTSGMGHPILGDHTYAKSFRCQYRAPRVLLHAATLRFKHPTQNKIVELSCEPPADFTACLQELF